jgi:hypothetical protein
MERGGEAYHKINMKEEIQTEGSKEEIRGDESPVLTLLKD